MWSRTLRPKIPSCDVIRWEHLYLFIGIKNSWWAFSDVKYCARAKNKTTAKADHSFFGCCCCFQKPLNFEEIATEAQSRGVDFWSPHHHLQLFIGAGTSSDAAKNLDTGANELTVLHLNYLPPGAIGLLVKCEEPHWAATGFDSGLHVCAWIWARRT